MSTEITLNVNGKSIKVPAEPMRTLLTVLRDELRLTGTKYGCGEGQCGACTVIMDGQTVRSCLLPVSSAANTTIQTIEGLQDGDNLHPLQESFLTHEALQCGYCTPGMIMNGVALLRKNNNPTQEDIKKAMNRNICRCGTYNRIVDAIEEAAQTMRENS